MNGRHQHADQREQSQQKLSLRSKALARGFGLIEQLVALSVAGVVSAVAVPQLTALQPLADAAALSHLAQSASSAMALNRVGCEVTGHHPSAGKCRPVTDCAEIGALLHGGLPAGYRVLPQALGDGHWRSNGVEGVCRLEHLASGLSQDFAGVAAGQ